MKKSRWKLLILVGLFLFSIFASPSVAQIRTSSAIIQSQFTTPDLIQQGQALYEAGEFEKAAVVWQDVIAALQTQGDDLNQAMALSNLSLTYQKLGEWEKATQAITDSLRLLGTEAEITSKNQLRLLAQSLNILGNLQLETGQAEDAIATWKRTVKIYTQLNDQNGRIQSQINQAQALQDLGLNYRACSTLFLALELQPESCEISSETLETITEKSMGYLEILALTGLGDILRGLGKFEQSEQILLEALQRAEQLGNSEEMAKISLSLGQTFRAKGETEAGIEYYLQSQQLAQSNLFQIQAQIEQLGLLVDAEKWLEAEALSQSLKPLIQNLTSTQTGLESQINFIQSFLNLLKHKPDDQQLEQEIENLLKFTIEKAQKNGSFRGLAYILGLSGKFYQLTQQWNLAEKFTLDALQEISAYNAPDITYQFLWQLGQIRKIQGQREEAIAAYTQAVDLLEFLRKDLVTVSSETRFSFRENIEPIYRELVELLVPQNMEVEQSALILARNQIESLQLAELNNFFKEACLDVEAKQIDEVDPEAAVIYTIILPERLLVITSLPGEPLKKYETLISKSEVEEVNRQLFLALTPVFPNSLRLQFSQQIYEWIIQPVEEDLERKNIKTLVFVLDGILRSLPMSALYDGQQYLIEKYNIALTPGLQLLEPKSIIPQHLKLLIAGLTEASQGFSALPAVGIEVTQISEQSSSEVLLNQTFTKANLQEEMDRLPFPIVHLATHGQFSSNQEETFILTWDDKIKINDLKNLLQTRETRDKTPVELLVLSACQTASGDSRAALGLAGLAVRSGARSTLATLWSVNDESTANLMVEFYQQLTQFQLSKTEALRQAQLKLLESSEYQHPYYWAPFVIIGNWL